MTEGERKAIERIIYANQRTLHLLSQNNDALLREYREATQEILTREMHGTPVPERYRQAVAELHDEIVRRMNA